MADDAGSPTSADGGRDGGDAPTCPGGFADDGTGTGRCLRDDPYLSGLVVGPGATLTHQFVPGPGMLWPPPTTTTLLVALPAGTISASVTLTPTVAEPTLATITVNGMPVASGATATVVLSATTIIEVVVTTWNGTTHTYLIEVDSSCASGAVVRVPGGPLDDLGIAGVETVAMVTGTVTAIATGTSWIAWVSEDATRSRLYAARTDGTDVSLVGEVPALGGIGPIGVVGCNNHIIEPIDACAGPDLLYWASHAGPVSGVHIIHETALAERLTCDRRAIEGVTHLVAVPSSGSLEPARAYVAANSSTGGQVFVVSSGSFFVGGGTGPDVGTVSALAAGNDAYQSVYILTTAPPLSNPSARCGLRCLSTPIQTACFDDYSYTCPTTSSGRHELLAYGNHVIRASSGSSGFSASRSTDPGDGLIFTYANPWLPLVEETSGGGSMLAAGGGRLFWLRPSGHIGTIVIDEASRWSLPAVVELPDLGSSPTLFGAASLEPWPTSETHFYWVDVTAIRRYRMP